MFDVRERLNRPRKRHGSDEVHEPWWAVDAVKAAVIACRIDQDEGRVPTIGSLGPGCGHETSFFMRMISMMMVRISRVDAKIQIIVVRVIAMIMTMGVVKHGQRRAVFDERMTTLWDERKHQRGEDRQRGHQARSESSSTPKLHADEIAVIDGGNKKAD
jgi:hypothetical protein